MKAIEANKLARKTNQILCGGEFPSFSQILEDIKNKANHGEYRLSYSLDCANEAHQKLAANIKEKLNELGYAVIYDRRVEDTNEMLYVYWVD